MSSSKHKKARVLLLNKPFSMSYMLMEIPCLSWWIKLEIKCTISYANYRGPICRRGFKDICGLA